MEAKFLKTYNAWMALTVFQKLMLTLLGLTAVILIATLGLARWSFERGFLDYANALEQTRLEVVSNNLTELYLEAGGDWKKIPKESLERHLYLLPKRSGSGLDKPLPPGIHKRQFDSKHHDTVSGSEKLIPLTSSETEYGNTQANGNLDTSPLNADLGTPPASHIGINRDKAAPFTALYDENHSFVAGDWMDDAENLSIAIPIIAMGKQIGELHSIPPRFFQSPLETEFSKQQLMRSIVIGTVALISAALLSWMLATLFLNRHRYVLKAIKSLTRGDYSPKKLLSGRDEVGLLMEDINYLAKTLEENRDSRRRWLADISHELRTPLTILTGEIQSLKDGIREFDYAQICSLEQEINFMRKLTDDLYELSVSDIGGLNYEFKKIDLETVLTTTCASYKNRALANDIKFDVSSMPQVFSGDSARLAQLFKNMLSNSLAYTDSPGVIEIRMISEDNLVTIIFEDSAPGVKPDDCERLFNPLHRQDESRTRRRDGSGLGLAISRNIVEAHRGKILASPSKLGGLKITITFPIINGYRR